MKDAAKKFRKTCEKCNKPFSTANESEVLCRECRMRDDFAKRRAEDEARKEADAKSNEVFETRKCVDCGHEFDITNPKRMQNRMGASLMKGNLIRIPKQRAARMERIHPLNLKR